MVLWEAATAPPYPAYNNTLITTLIATFQLETMAGPDSSFPTPHSCSPSRSPSYDSEDLEVQEIELEERLNLFSKKALHSARSSRPENTKKAYKPRQKEWRVSIIPGLFLSSLYVIPN